MPDKYRSRSFGDNCDSEYECNDKILNPLNEIFAHGNNAIARKLEDKEIQDKLLVLNPLHPEQVDIEEAQMKFAFFSTLYPDQSAKLFIKNNTYRLVLTKLPGETYTKLKLENIRPEALMLSTILALKDCHERGFVVCDLKADNILYDVKTGKSYLIDGGTAARINLSVRAILQCPDQATLDSAKIKYQHIAPECFTLAPNPAMAQCSMDVYSFSLMFSKFKINGIMKKLLLLCRDLNPELRPTLETLERHLKDSLSSKSDYQQASETLESFGLLINATQAQKLQNWPELQRKINKLNLGCRKFNKIIALDDRKPLAACQTKILESILARLESPSHPAQFVMETQKIKNQAITTITNIKVNEWIQKALNNLEKLLGYLPANLEQGRSLLLHQPNKSPKAEPSPKETIISRPN